MIVAWSKAGLGEGSKEEGPDGARARTHTHTPRKQGKSTVPPHQRPLTDCSTQGESASLSLVPLGHDVGSESASELDDVLGPSELAALGDTCSLLRKPKCEFEGQLDEATGDPGGTAALSTSTTRPLTHRWRQHCWLPAFVRS